MITHCVCFIERVSLMILYLKKPAIREIVDFQLRILTSDSEKHVTGRSTPVIIGYRPQFPRWTALPRGSDHRYHETSDVIGSILTLLLDSPETKLDMADIYRGTTVRLRTLDPWRTRVKEDPEW
jgi:hypothetical protein